jgi:hypothetical protein
MNITPDNGSSSNPTPVTENQALGHHAGFRRNIALAADLGICLFDKHGPDRLLLLDLFITHPKPWLIRGTYGVKAGLSRDVHDDPLVAGNETTTRNLLS